MNSPGEAELLQRCRAGDPQAVEMLVSRYQRDVYRLAFAILEDPAGAEEATLESLVTAIQRIGSLKGNASFKPWLFAIAIRVCRRRQSRNLLGKVFSRLLPESGPSQLQPAGQAIQVEGKGEFYKAASKLPDRLRLPLVLRYYLEMPVAEIAQVLGISEQTAHIRLRAAHLALNTNLDLV